MSKDRVFYSEEEIEGILAGDGGGLNTQEAKFVARILDGYTFGQLKNISDAVKKISKGK